MKKRALAVARAACVCGIFVASCGAFAGDPEIEIKGVRIGMSKQDLDSKYPSWEGFTVAGVPSKSKYAPGPYDFHDGKLDYFGFSFDPRKFDSIREALKAKYPGLSCENSAVSNAMGATFEQTECNLRGSNASLRLSRFGSDITSGLLFLVSHRALEERARRIAEEKSDL